VGETVRSLFHLILILVVSVGCSATLKAADEIAYERDKFGRILVPIDLGDGQNRRFLLDTGARRFAVNAGMLPHKKIREFERSTINYMSSAGVLRLPLVKLENVGFIQNNREGLIAGVFPAKFKSVGIAGFDAYHGYILHINPAKQQLGLYGNVGSFALRDWRLITGNPNVYGGLLLETEYKGVALTVLLSSGLSKSMLDIQAAALLFPDKVTQFHVTPGKEYGTERVVMGLDPRQKVYSTLILKDFNIRGWQLGDIEVAVNHLPVRKNTGYINTAFLMLGADVLAEKEYAIDSRGHQLWLPPEE
jgi:hypothetical protein